MRIVTDATITPAAYSHEHLVYGAVYARTRIIGIGLRVYAGPGDWRHGDPAVLPGPATPQRVLESGIYLGRFFSHFGHFLIETLPALGLADPNSDEPLIFHPWPETFTTDEAARAFRQYFFTALGVDPKRLVFASAPLHVRRLAITDTHIHTMLARQEGSAVDTFRRIRAFSTVHGNTRFWSRLYMSRRRHPGSRRIINEEDVERIFARRGFAILYPEQLPIADQVDAVSRAEVVAGLDGSALHMCSFMPPRARAIVLASRTIQIFTAINNAIGVETIASHSCRTDDQGIVVDLDRLESDLQAALPQATQSTEVAGFSSMYSDGTGTFTLPWRRRVDETP